jgi:hypothetical protein
MTKSELDCHFTFDPITNEAAERVGAIRSAGKSLAFAIFDKAPDGSFKDGAIAHVIEAVMLANASIANANPIPPPGPPAAPGDFSNSPTPKALP